MILKAQNRSTRTKTCANDNFPKPKTRKLANNRMTYGYNFISKKIGIYTNMYRFSPYLAENTVFPSEAAMGE